MHADLLLRVVFPTGFLLLFHFCGGKKKCIHTRTFRKSSGFHIAFWSSEDQTKSSHLVQFGHSSKQRHLQCNFLGFSCPLSIEEILKNVFIYFSKLIFINLLFISHFPISQKAFWLFLQKHCLKLRFHFNISVMWAVHWWFLLLGLARKTFHFVHIPFFKHLFWEMKLKWQNNDRLKNSHYPIWGLMALPHMECGMFTFF